MEYEQPTPVSKDEAERVFATGEVDPICRTLVAVALNEPDRQWVQEKCIGFAGSPDWRLRAIAATCLGHVARIHGQLDVARVKPLLATLRNDPATQGYAEDALGDIRMFLERR